MKKTNCWKGLLSLLLVLCMVFQTCGFVLADDGTQVVYDVNLAAGKTAIANSDAGLPQFFRQVYLTDGVTDCGNGNFGYSSQFSGTADFSAAPVSITVDLGGQYAFNQLMLYPRNDVSTAVPGESSPHYPVDFTVEASKDGSQWTTVKTVTGNTNPDGASQSIPLDPAEGRYVRLTVTKVGYPSSVETNYYVQLAEIQVYNRETIAPDPSVITSYTIDFDFQIDKDNQGFCFGMANTNNFVMWQVSSNAPEDPTADSVMLRPHFKSGGSWTAYPGGPGNVSAVDITDAIGYKASEILGKVIHERIVVNGANIKTYFGPDAEKLTLASDYTHSAAIPLHQVGFRQYNGDTDHELVRYDNILVRDAQDNVIYDMNFDNGSVGFTSTNGTVFVENGWLRVGADTEVGEQFYTMIEFGETFTDIPYAANSNAQQLDIQLPVGEGPHPVVLYFHGGDWLSGDKADISEARNVLENLVGRGCAVVSVNYRLASEAKWPAQLHDAKAAVRFVRANAETYGFDPDRIAAFGSSVGGHLALMTGLTGGVAQLEDLTMGNAAYSSEIMAAASNYGICDLTDDTIANVDALLGEGYTEEQALAASPITYVSEDSVPAYLAHGQDDSVVAPAHSMELAEALSVYGISKVDTYYPAHGAHGDSVFWNSAVPANAVAAFLGKWFEPHVILAGSDNAQPAGNVDLKSYPNAYPMLRYANGSDAQLLHIVTPIEGEGPYPTIVFIHGGGFSACNSANGSVVWTCKAALRAVDEGYAVAMVDYRLSGEAKFPAPIHDIKAAIRYLRANADTYHLDTERIAIWGESAGGHLASFVALTNNEPAYEDLSMGYKDYSSEVQACVAWYPITDLTTANNNQKGYTGNLMGFTATANYDACLAASPVGQVKETACPFYIQHGLADTTVDYQDGIDLYNLLVAATGEEDHRLELFPGLVHGPGKFFYKENIRSICNWLDEKLDVPVEEQAVNLALGKPVAASSGLNNIYFNNAYLTDGVKVCVGSNFGYSSKSYRSAEVSADPVVITVDLGEEMDFNQVVIFPRNDVTSAEGDTVGFMKDFTIQVSADGDAWDTVCVIEDNENPNGRSQCYDFAAANARYVRITATELGLEPIVGGGYYLQLAELEVYDREPAASDVAKAVDALIEAIDMEDKATIDAARAAYNALTEEQKALVTGLAELEAAEIQWKTVNEAVALTLTGAEEINVADKEAVYILSAENMTNLATMILTFEIPSSYLTDPVAEEAGDWYIMDQAYQDGKFYVAIGNNQGANGSADLLTITMKPANVPGEAVITLAEADLSAYLGESEIFVPVDVSAASITTTVKHNRFDVNRDGVVDQLDMTRAQKYYGTDFADADVDESGEVDLTDLILILNEFSDLFE